jgi:hypothetical protein
MPGMEWAVDVDSQGELYWVYEVVMTEEMAMFLAFYSATRIRALRGE